MAEYGLFSDEGCVESEFFSMDDARQALTDYSEEDRLEALEICGDHEEQPRVSCEKCYGEEVH